MADDHVKGEFDVSKYLKWRQNFKVGPYANIPVKEDEPTPLEPSAGEPGGSKLSLHRENLKLRDELTALRVELFT